MAPRTRWTAGAVALALLSAGTMLPPLLTAVAILAPPAADLLPGGSVAIQVTHIEGPVHSPPRGLGCVLAFTQPSPALRSGQDTDSAQTCFTDDGISQGNMLLTALRARGTLQIQVSAGNVTHLAIPFTIPAGMTAHVLLENVGGTPTVTPQGTLTPWGGGTGWMLASAMQAVLFMGALLALGAAQRRWAFWLLVAASLLWLPLAGTGRLQLGGVLLAVAWLLLLAQTRQEMQKPVQRELGVGPP